MTRLNARLAEFDPESPYDQEGNEEGLGLGLYVVARLAHRHGVRVQLREQKQGGVAAVVVLPGPPARRGSAVRRPVRHRAHHGRHPRLLPPRRRRRGQLQRPLRPFDRHRPAGHTGGERGTRAAGAGAGGRTGTGRPDGTGAHGHPAAADLRRRTADRRPAAGV